MLKLIRNAATLVVLLAGIVGYAHATAVCPDTTVAGGTANDCNEEITFGPGNTFSVTGGPSPSTNYDGSDDALVGLINNSGTTLYSFTLTDTGSDIYGFDGDGIDFYVPVNNALDGTGYGGPLAYFTNIDAAGDSGTVNISGGLASGATTYFSLENPVNAAQPIVPTAPGTGGDPTTVPEPSTLALMLLASCGLFAMARKAI